MFHTDANEQRALRNPKVKNLDIAGFLIKPTQRLALYPLLFEDIIKNTEKDHPDYGNLCKVLTSVKAILIEVNESTRMRESQEYFHTFLEHVIWETTVCYHFLKNSLSLVLFNVIFMFLFYETAN